MSDSSGLKTKAWAFFAFLVFGLPFAIFGIWGSFEKDKTIPQWLAERGWTMRQIAVPYLISAAVVSFVLYLVLAAYSRRRERPNLNGEIICLEDDARLDQIDRDYDCFITLCVKVRNSGTPTAVDSFSLNLWWDGVDHPGTDEPLNGYYVETWGREPGDERSQHKIRATELKEFPCGEEITTTSKTGWRRFSFGSMPPEMVEGGHRAVESGHLAKQVIVELIALDSQGKPHTIYEGVMYEGVRRLISGCGKIKREPADNFFFAS